MAVTCKKCNRLIRTNQKYVNCGHCNDVFHINCGQISDVLVKQIEQGITDWRCTICRTAKNRRSIVNIGSDVDKRSSSPSINQAACSFNLSSSTSNINAATPNLSDPNDLSANLATLSLNIKNLAENQQGTMVSLAAISKQMSTLQSLHSTVDKHEHRIKTLEEENISMKNMIKNLSSKIDNCEQKSNNNKLQLNLVPYTQNEDLHRIVIDIADKLNVTVDKNDIIDVYRTKVSKDPKSIKNNNAIVNPESDVVSTDAAGTFANIESDVIAIDDNDADDSEGACAVAGKSVNSSNDSTVNSIIVRFKSRSTTQAILQRYRNIPNHKLFFDDNNKHRIFVNEFLISYRRRLFFKAKLFCKVNNYKYLWTRNGNIFIRKQDGSKRILINHNIDFASIEDPMVEASTSV